MPDPSRLLSLTGGLMAAVLLCACSSGSDGRTDSAGIARLRGLSLLDASLLESGELRLERSSMDGRELLQLYADDVRGLQRLYVSIPSAFEHFTLATQQSAGLAGLSPLSLAVPLEHELQFGWVAVDEAFSGSGLLASFSLERIGAEAHEQAQAQRIASTAVDSLVRNARWNILSWYYQNPGDYDQNGIVGITDLTPLGQNFLQEGPFEPDSAQWMVDGDGNGLINLADISVIGQNFGNAVNGYELYAAADGNGYPDTAGARLVASLALTDSLGDSSQRRSFRLTDLAVQLDDRYWVQPAAGGTASALTAEWEKQWHLEPLYSIPIDGGFGTAGLCLSVVDGRPCVAFAGGDTSSEAYFCRAKDAVGSQWELPVIVPTGLQFPNVSSIVEQDGKPAILGGDNNIFHLQRALDEQGTTWDSPVPAVADSRFSALEFVHEGRLRSYNIGLNTINLISGDSELPVNFPGDLLIADVYSSVATYHNGMLAMAYHDLPMDKCVFRLAQISGDNISTVISKEPETSTDFSGVAELMYFNDRPYLWVTRNSGDDLFQMRSADGDGNTWNAPVELDFGPGYFTGMDVIEAYGQMFMLNRGWDEIGLECRTNSDGDPQNWQLQAEFMEGHFTVPWADLQVIRGHPSTVVLQENAGSLDYFFARFH